MKARGVEYEPFATADTPLSPKFGEHESSCARSAAAARPLFLLFVPFLIMLLIAIGTVLPWFKNDTSIVFGNPVTIHTEFHLARYIITTKTTKPDGSVETETTTYKYSDQSLKDLVPRMDQVITASATVVALAYAGVAMAVCSFVTMLIVLIVGHFRDGELHDCGDFCSLLVSRHAFRSEDSWLGFPRLPNLFLVLAAVFSMASWVQYIVSMSLWTKASALPEYAVENNGTYHWGEGLALLLSASVLAFVGSIIVATPIPLLRCLGFKTGYE